MGDALARTGGALACCSAGKLRCERAKIAAGRRLVGQVGVCVPPRVRASNTLLYRPKNAEMRMPTDFTRIRVGGFPEFPLKPVYPVKQKVAAPRVFRLQPSKQAKPGRRGGDWRISERYFANHVPRWSPRMLLWPTRRRHLIGGRIDASRARCLDGVCFFTAQKQPIVSLLLRHFCDLHHSNSGGNQKALNFKAPVVFCSAPCVTGQLPGQIVWPGASAGPRELRQDSKAASLLRAGGSVDAVDSTPRASVGAQSSDWRLPNPRRIASVHTKRVAGVSTQHIPRASRSQARRREISRWVAESTAARRSWESNGGSRSSRRRRASSQSACLA